MMVVVELVQKMVVAGLVQKMLVAFHDMLELNTLVIHFDHYFHHYC
jgi:hypothetical protein